MTICVRTPGAQSKESPYVLDIPPGREFESSVPRSLQWLWSPDDPYFLKAALLHDVLLESGARDFEADSQWRAAAFGEKAPAVRTGFAYLGMLIRRFGQWTFKKTSVQWRPRRARTPLDTGPQSPNRTPPTSKRLGRSPLIRDRH